MRGSETRQILRDTVVVFVFALVLTLGVCEFVPVEACAPVVCNETCCTCVRSSVARPAPRLRRAVLPLGLARLALQVPLPVRRPARLHPVGSAPKPKSGFDRYSDWARAPSSTGSSLVLA
jgi:hypothetical protein